MALLSPCPSSVLATGSRCPAPRTSASEPPEAWAEWADEWRDGSRIPRARWEPMGPPLLGSLPALAALAVGAVRLRRLRRLRGSRRWRSTLRAANVDIEEGEKVVGIDLGTTNSAVAALEAGKATVIPGADGARTTPSVIAYTKTGETLVGQKAKRQAAVNPANTFYSVKRFIGRLRNEIDEEVSEVSYGIVGEDEQAEGVLGVRLECPHLEKQLSPEEISAQVLRTLAGAASKYLQADVKKAVITVPAYFNDSQRQATKDAGAIAGLEVLRIVNEPTAASLAYGLEKRDNETILVFDLGGGTFDVSVLVVGGGVCEVLATSGDTKLGGDNFDKCIVDWLAHRFATRTLIDLREDPQSLQRLTEAAEKAKIELSGVLSTTISLPFITVDEDGSPLHIEEELTRGEFEGLCSKLLERLREPVEKALKDSDLTYTDLDEIVLVGGSTRIGAVQELVRSLVGGKELNQSVNPDEVVAMGAAVQAGVLAGEVKDLVLLDVVPLSLSVATHDGLSSVFLPRNTRVPAKKTKVFSTAMDNQPRVTVEVVQGEFRKADDNKQLGVFLLDGIPPSPAGIPQIEVTFDVDSNGILSVSAYDRATRKETKVTISGASTLAPEDVQEKVAEAEKKAAEEAYYEQVVMVKNDAESAAYAVERLLRDQRRKLKPTKVEVLESKLLLARDLLDKEPPDTDLLKQVTEDLREEVRNILKRKVEEEYDVEQGPTLSYGYVQVQ
ncbi:dnaK2 [Symbiodinium natans]|uniref:DnaK2 protein n=1 Tax=Symbiodinium natans TaxID=878477 RepID=A0A812P4A7_9DINO|nr:dnaK2 [Symbiodinium natans]